MTMQEITTLFGWMSIFHISALTLAFVFITLFDDFVFTIHKKLFGIEKAVLKPMYLTVLGQYKILFFVFALAPYFALKLMDY